MAKRKSQPRFTTHVKMLPLPGSGVVPLDDHYALPRQFTVTTELDGGAQAELEVAVDERGAPRCLRLEVHTPGNGGITTETLRSIAVSRLLHLATTNVLMKHEQLPEGHVKVVPADNEDKRQFYQRYSRARRPRQGSPLTDETLIKVTTVYRAASGRGDPPTQTVAETMNVARSTAARWVAKAREAGHLGPAIRGRAGEGN